MNKSCAQWNKVSSFDSLSGNSKSGSSEADAVLSSFCSVLNPAQVIDLNRCSPEEALEWCHLLPPDVTCRVVVAGGDGTVCWVLTSILKMKFEVWNDTPTT